MAISEAQNSIKPRSIQKISLHNFSERRDEIAKQIIDAAENNGFFALVNQESPSPEEIEEVFTISQKFFSLPDEIKAQTPLRKTENAGWECRSQVRPSTGVADQKESIQLQYHRRHDSSWPSDEALSPELKEKLCTFMEKTHKLSQEVLSIFAEALGFPKDHFARAHQVTEDDAQSTLRLLHYQDIEGIEFPQQYWRAGAHTDFDCLTMLFQRTGEDGLEVCPGREAHSDFARGDSWTPVEPITGEIVCNIGDMLMAWSDDRFKSLFHRVRCPKIGENQKERYSIAYFNQANKNVVVQGPKKKYPPMTAHEYIIGALQRNFAQLKT
ncbi:Clavaminate synthase-like protein [Wilcoxina mikolae CBS 423.85]|nr:Clavaminate synthase-like protein [Wilcoxina mikolae CBS 423.85]